MGSCCLGKGFPDIAAVAISANLLQMMTTIDMVLASMAALYGVGNHLEIVAETGSLPNFLKFLWLTVFFFNLAIPLGKVAAAVFLMEINGQASTSRLLISARYKSGF